MWIEKRLAPKASYLNKLLVSLLFFLLSTPSVAAGESPIGKGLRYVLNDILYSPTGLTIATIAVIGVGIACAFGYLEWRRLGNTIIGISIVFGAPAIVSGIKSLLGS